MAIRRLGFRGMTLETGIQHHHPHPRQTQRKHLHYTGIAMGDTTIEISLDRWCKEIVDKTYNFNEYSHTLLNSPSVH